MSAASRRCSGKRLRGPEPKLLLVTGCGRSGTKFISVLLRKLGLDVPHERMGRDGIVAWTMAVPAPATPWGPGSSAFAFEHVFHQVRHPLQVIASCRTFKPSSWEYISSHSTASPADPPSIRAAKYWLDWNAHAERIATWRFRIEDIASVYAELCERLGVTSDPTALAGLAADVNTRRRGRNFHYYDAACARLRIRRVAPLEKLLSRSSPEDPRVEWDNLAAVDAALCARLREKAREYGYEA